MWYVDTKEFYSPIRKNESTWFECKWMHLEDIMLSEVKPSSEKQRPHIFCQMWKIDSKDKHIHKNKHDHIQTYV
jgi:hypothetical protein